MWALCWSRFGREAKVGNLRDGGLIKKGAFRLMSLCQKMLFSVTTGYRLSLWRTSDCAESELDGCDVVFIDDPVLINVCEIVFSSRRQSSCGVISIEQVHAIDHPIEIDVCRLNGSHPAEPHLVGVDAKPAVFNLT